MKLYQITGTPDTVAAENLLEALDFYAEIDGNSEHEARLIPDSELDVMEVYDEDGYVHGEPCIVTYRELYNVDMMELALNYLHRYITGQWLTLQHLPTL